MNAFIRLLYGVFIAGAVVAFIGVGIASFYQPPKYPESTFSPNASQEEMDKEQAASEKMWKDHEKAQEAYNKNVTYMVIPAAIVVLAFGLIYMKKSEVIGEGLALGGIGTSLYGIVTSSIAHQNILRFLSVTLLLVGVLLLTQKRFLEPTKKK